MGNKPMVNVFEAYDAGDLKKANEILEKDLKSIPKEDLNKGIESKNGRPALLVFVENENYQLVQTILKHPFVGINIECNEKGKDGRTPLIEAVEKKNMKILELLLKNRRLKINHRAEDASDGSFFSRTQTKSALRTAVDLDEPDILRRLLAHEEACITYLGHPLKGNLIYYAAQKGKMKALRVLCEGRDKQVIMGSHGARTVNVAALYGQLEVVKFLIDEVQIDFKQSSSLGSIIRICESRKEHAILRYVTEVLKRPATLIAACKRGDLPEVKRLLSIPRSVLNDVIRGECAISATCSVRNSEVFDLLLSHENLNVNSGFALNRLCDGALGPLNSEMISRLVQHPKIDLFAPYSNKKFMNVNALGMLCYYGSEKDAESVRFILKKYEEVKKRPILIHRADGNCVMYETEKKLFAFGIEVKSNPMSYLSLSIEARNWAVFRELISFAPTPREGSDGVEERTFPTPFSPLATFLLWALPAHPNMPVPEDEREMALEMFRLYLKNQENNEKLWEDQAIGPAHPNVDPFRFVLNNVVNDSVILAILSSPPFKARDDYHPNYETEFAGMLRELVIRNCVKSSAHYLRCFNKVDMKEGYYRVILINDSPTLEMRKVIIEYIRGQMDVFKISIPKRLQLFFSCQLSEIEKIKKLIFPDVYEAIYEQDDEEEEGEGQVKEECELVNARVHHMTPLLIACKVRDVEQVKLLLSHPNIDINKVGDLLSFGEKPQAYKEDEATPLMMACLNGLEGAPCLPVNEEIVQLLVEREEVDVNFGVWKEKKNEEGEIVKGGPSEMSGPPLFIACLTRAPISVISCLLEHEKCDVNVRCFHGTKDNMTETNVLVTTICSEFIHNMDDPVIRKRAVETAELILQHENFDGIADFELNKLVGFPGLSQSAHPLAFACAKGLTEVAELILNCHDVNMNIGDPVPYLATKDATLLSRMFCHRNFDESAIPFEKCQNTEFPSNMEEFEKFKKECSDRIKEIETIEEEETEGEKEKSVELGQEERKEINRVIIT